MKEDRSKQSEMDDKKEILMQMCGQYLGLQSQHQMERMQKILESMDDASVEKCFEVIRMDLKAVYKRQIAQLKQQIRMME